MAKVFTITVLLLGLILLMSMMGVPTLSGGLYNAVFGSGESNAPNGELYNLLNTWIFVAIGAMIIVGLYLRQSSESFLTTVIASSLCTWTIADLTWIAFLPMGESWMSSVLKFIMLPLIGGYLIAIVQWWRGNDIL